MARTAACPSCGAPVEFRSAASILAVCNFCRSTLLRSGEAIENLGRMADLVADDSPLQIGAEGRWEGRRFGIVGRIQLRYEAGLWNEWHLLFDDGRSGWLSEAGGEYVISSLKWIADPLPAFADVVAGEAVTLDGRSYEVTDIENAECVAGAGELPFKVGGGYPAPLVDLRAGDQFATIDYSDGKPLVFFGTPVPFAAFDWANLRQDVPLPKITGKAEALQCPACGAAIAIHDEAVASVVCAHCGSQSDRVDGQLELVRRVREQLAAAPWLPLGSSGTLRGEACEVIGAMVRSTTVDGVNYAWREYLLLAKKEVAGASVSVFLWLTEYDGHWTLARTLSSPPKTASSALAEIRYEGARYEHFQHSSARVDFVLGEFTWKVRVGDATEIDDYIAPPALLSREWTDKEVVWSRAEYVEPDEIVAAFKPAGQPPKRVGVGACQPSPVRERHRIVCRRFWQFALIAILIQIVSAVFFGEKVLLRQDLALQAERDDPLLTREFRIDSGPAKVTVRNKAAVSNNWVAFNVAVVDKASGRNWSDNREIAYYFGNDGGESWSEGSPEDSVVFRDLPAGTYLLAIDPELPATAGSVISDTVEVVQGERVWSNLFLFLFLTALFPLFTRWRQAVFEIRRWEDSDHPKIKSSDDEDGDGGDD